MVIGEVLVKALAGFGRGFVGTFSRPCVRSLQTIHPLTQTNKRERASARAREAEMQTDRDSERGRERGRDADRYR